MATYFCPLPIRTIAPDRRLAPFYIVALLGVALLGLGCERGEGPADRDYLTLWVASADSTQPAPIEIPIPNSISSRFAGPNIG